MASNMLLKKIIPNREEEYSVLLTNCSSAMFYHSIPYLKMVCELLKGAYEIWGLYENEKLLAACPWIIKEGKYGIVYNSLAYYGSNGGIIGVNETSCSELEKQMLTQLSKQCATFSYITSTAKPNKLSQEFELFNQERRAQITALPRVSEKVEEHIMQMCHSKNRNTIRKAFKENITFQKNKDWAFLYNTHVANMEAIGVKAKEEHFFSSLSQFYRYGEDYEIVEAHIDGVKACAVLVFYFKHTIYYYTPAVLQQFRNKQPLSALIYHMMCDGVTKGFKFWDWGGTPLSNEALYKFKKRWGTEDRPYFIQSKVYNQNIFNATPAELSQEYPGMFVAPYELLKTN